MTPNTGVCGVCVQVHACNKISFIGSNLERNTKKVKNKHAQERTCASLREDS